MDRELWHQLDGLYREYVDALERAQHMGATDDERLDAWRRVVELDQELCEILPPRA